MAQSNQDYALISELVQGGPMRPFAGMLIDPTSEIAPPDNRGIEVIADMRVVDLRQLQLDASPTTNEQSIAFVYRRMRIQKSAPTAKRFTMRSRMPTERVDVRALNIQVPAVIRRSPDLAAGVGKTIHTFEVAFDLSKIPVHQTIDLPVEFMSSEPASGAVRSATFYVDDETGILSCWLLLPEGNRYTNFELLRYQTGKDMVPERVTPAYHFDTLEGRVLSFALLNVEPGFTFEASWENLE
jgi:hypothetical protein